MNYRIGPYCYIIESNLSQYLCMYCVQQRKLRLFILQLKKRQLYRECKSVSEKRIEGNSVREYSCSVLHFTALFILKDYDNYPYLLYNLMITTRIQ